MAARKCVLIISGGLDSVILAHYLHQNFELSLLSFDYGQKHRKELHFAKLCADTLKVPYHEVNLQSLNSLLPSSLTDGSKEIPDGHFASSAMKTTVVPNRNAIMLSIAWGHAVALGAQKVAFGAHHGDSFVYPDCRPEFRLKIEEAFRLGNEGLGDPSLSLYAPLIHYTKAQIVKLGEVLQVPFESTWSCYRGEHLHCGTCGTCTERILAFKEARVFDPTFYCCSKLSEHNEDTPSEELLIPQPYILKKGDL